MGVKSRRKGQEYEREVCKEILDRIGLRIERKLGQERDGGNDIDLQLAQAGSLRIECKRRARIGNVREWLEQLEELVATAQEDVPCIVMRADGWPSSLVVLELADFLALIESELMATKGRALDVLYDRLDTMEALRFLKPEHKRRMEACLFACSFSSTEDLEKIAALDLEERRAAVKAMVRA